MEANQPQPSQSQEAAAVETASDLPPENGVDLSKERRKPSKAEIKAQQRTRERMNRWQNAHEEWLKNWRNENKGASKEEETAAFDNAAFQAIQREDYENLPVDKKLRILERSLVMFQQGIVGDIRALQQNDRSITHVFDVNLRTIARLFEKLGIDKEAQRKILDEIQNEMEAEDRERLIKARQEREAAAAAKLNKEVDAKPEEGAKVEVPEGATEFT